MITLTEHTKVEIGKFYLVPCAKIIDKITKGFVYFVPVIGKEHTDKGAFNFPHSHYHIDARFCNDHLKKEYKIDDLGRTNYVHCDKTGSSNHYFIKIVFLRRKCQRLTTGIIPPDASFKDAIHRKYSSWYNKFIGKSCKGKRCPHLGTVMHEREGKLVCPLHNLIGDAHTEKIIPLP